MRLFFSFLFFLPTPWPTSPSLVRRPRCPRRAREPSNRSAPSPSTLTRCARNCHARPSRSSRFVVSTPLSLPFRSPFHSSPRPTAAPSTPRARTHHPLSLEKQEVLHVKGKKLAPEVSNINIFDNINNNIFDNNNITDTRDETTARRAGRARHEGVGHRERGHTLFTLVPAPDRKHGRETRRLPRA